MTYRRALSLDTLVAEVNAAAPRRDKASDGWIGDPSHQSRTSDHNPWMKDARGVGVVRAQDIDHDAANGCDAGELAAQITALLGLHPALGNGAYVIYNRRIVSTSRIREGWRPYSGSNAHTQHVHVSVGYAGYDSTTPWGVLASMRVKVLPKRIQATITQIDREIIRVRTARKVAKSKGERPASYTDALLALRAARKAARSVPKR